VLCTRCASSSTEIPEEMEELKPIREEMSRAYPIALYCSHHKAIVVGDPASPAKRVDECEFFTAR